MRRRTDDWWHSGGGRAAAAAAAAMCAAPTSEVERCLDVRRCCDPRKDRHLTSDAVAHDLRIHPRGDHKLRPGTDGCLRLLDRQYGPSTCSHTHQRASRRPNRVIISASGLTGTGDWLAARRARDEPHRCRPPERPRPAAPAGHPPLQRCGT